MIDGAGVNRGKRPAWGSKVRAVQDVHTSVCYLGLSFSVCILCPLPTFIPFIYSLFTCFSKIISLSISFFIFYSLDVFLGHECKATLYCQSVTFLIKIVKKSTQILYFVKNTSSVPCKFNLTTPDGLLHTTIWEGSIKTTVRKGQALWKNSFQVIG